MPNRKTQIIERYQIVLQDKIDVYKDLIDSLTQDAQNDAKSSAGDKHETTLSKLHIEQEKIAIKLKEAQEQLNILNAIDRAKKSDLVVKGSLVETNHLTVLVSCALPKITIDGKSYFGISPQSPLGLVLIGKKIGESFEVNRVEYNVWSIQ